MKTFVKFLLCAVAVIIAAAILFGVFNMIIGSYFSNNAFMGLLIVVVALAAIVFLFWSLIKVINLKK